ncbi:MAG: Rrf2 family transcriptional regulator [Chitinophagaceae bacterium]
MFSKTCEYAIRALILISQKSKNGCKTGIKEIAEAIDAPEPFIAKILHDLSRKGLVQSLKGPTGGFYLDKHSLQNSLADIVKAVDGDKIFYGCGLGLSYCSEKKPCPMHDKFVKVRKDIHEMLQSAKLGELQEQLEGKLAYLKQR